MVIDLKQKYKLVFAIEKSEIFDWLLRPYAVQIMKNGMFAYNHIPVTSQTIKHYTKDYSEAEFAAISLLDNCHSTMLAQTIGYGKYRSNDFFKELSKNENLKKRTIKFLRKKVDEAISILAEHKIPMYFKGDSEDIINENPITPISEKLKVLFTFDLQKDNLIYKIETQLGENKIKLDEKNTIILIYEPCWLIHKDMFIQVDQNIDGKKIEPFLKKDFVSVEKAHVENYLNRFVKQIISLYPYKLIGINENNYNKTPIPELSIETTLNNETALALYFNYKNEKFRYKSEKSSQISLVKEGSDFTFNIIRRSDIYEEKIVNWLKDNGFIPSSGPYFLPINIHLSKNDKQNGQNTYDVINFINENAASLNKKGIKISKSLNKNFFIGQIQLFKEHSQKQDWFDLKIHVQFGDFKIPFSALRKNILDNNREFILPYFNIAILPSEWFSKFHDLAIIGKIDGENIKVKKNQFSLINNLLDGESRLENFLQKSSAGDFPIEEPPEGLLKTLRPYQQKGMSWFMYLESNNFGGCLSDDMGLGKTIQVIAFLLKMKQLNAAKTEEEADGFSNTSLIIMPLSLIHNWQNEIQNTAPDLKVLNYTGTFRSFNEETISKHDLVLTTYGTIRNDYEKFSKFPFRFVFLDESQYIKNPESKIFAAVSKLNSKQRFVLTGTPIENSLIDLWSQLQFVNPGILGDLKYFRSKFFQPIERKGSKTSENRFRQIINPFILRRTKNEVAKELPELTEKIHFCQMTPEQKEIYEKRKSEIRNFILESTKKLGQEKTYMIILSGLMKLRLLANHPIINERNFEGESGKFIQVTESIKKVLDGNHKLLIFSQFVKHLAIYEAWLNEQNIPYLKLTGQTNIAERENMIKKFQKDTNYNIFLISLKAGGVGLNLTAADFVFLLDPWWNPAVEQQAINRTHRIGQDKKVISYKFITEESIEEKIMAMQDKKKDLFNNYINYKNKSLINQSELVDLLY